MNKTIFPQNAFSKIWYHPLSTLFYVCLSGTKASHRNNVPAKGETGVKVWKICQSLNCYFQVLVDLTGKDQNVILFSPPMCFTMENGRVFTKCLDEVLASTSNRWKILSKLFQFLNIPGHPISPHSKGSATRQLLWSWQTHWEWGNGRSWKRPSGRKELGWRQRWRRRVTKRWTRTFIKRL